ncbi:MAG: leucine-rich repeat domain-containing protein [Tissierellia bacterium]|nr:leucine-rich repeat domain-containing protein [Tissierellia bacterium]
MGSAAFQACIGLTSIAIPPLVSSIRDYTFSGCNNLISIEFPPALESIGDYAFYNCTSLSSIKTGTTTPPGLSVDVFYLVDKTKCLLYVPIGSLSAYKEADQWKDFLTILEFDPAGISKVNCPIIAIYPNPTQTHVTIELGEASINARLILYNSLGQTVYECQTANEWMSLDVSRFPAGTYVVNVKGNGNQKQWVGKFIKE